MRRVMLTVNEVRPPRARATMRLMVEPATNAPADGRAPFERFRRRMGGYLEDAVLGANDGIITTFAVVSGAEGGTLGVAVVLVLGFANLFADGVSMGASNLLAKRSKGDVVEKEKERLAWEIEHRPEEKRAELKSELAEQGVRRAERPKIVRDLTRHRWTWLLGLAALRSGLGEEAGSPWKHALATLAAFIITGTVPLLPYLFGRGAHTFLIATLAAGVALFGAGALRCIITQKGWLRSGLEMLAVGSIAGVVAYLVGLLGTLVGAGR